MSKRAKLEIRVRAELRPDRRFRGRVKSAAGLAWQYIRWHYPEIVLHDPDGSHPNLHGSYLTALVLYATIYSRSPEGVQYRPTAVSAGDAAKLQEAALYALGVGYRPGYVPTTGVARDELWDRYR